MAQQTCVYTASSECSRLWYSFNIPMNATLSESAYPELHGGFS